MVEEGFVMEEDDKGTKEATKKAYEEAEKVWDKYKDRLHEVLEKIADEARALCPKDTGALMRSIRIESGEGLDIGGAYEVAAGHILVDEMVVAGGVMDAESGKFVDYASAVEEGHATKSGGFVPPSYFMRDALIMYEEELDSIVSEILDEIEKTVGG